MTVSAAGVPSASIGTTPFVPVVFPSNPSYVPGCLPPQLTRASTLVVGGGGGMNANLNGLVASVAVDFVCTNSVAGTDDTISGCGNTVNGSQVRVTGSNDVVVGSFDTVTASTDKLAGSSDAVATSRTSATAFNAPPRCPPRALAAAAAAGAFLTAAAACTGACAVPASSITDRIIVDVA